MKYGLYIDSKFFDIPNIKAFIKYNKKNKDNEWKAVMKDIAFTYCIIDSMLRLEELHLIRCKRQVPKKDSFENIHYLTVKKLALEFPEINQYIKERSK